MMTRAGIAGLLTLTILGAPGLAAPPENLDYDLTIQGVALRPGVAADLHLSVFVNERNPCFGRTVFAVPGIAHTAATWKPFAEAVFDRTPVGEDIDTGLCRLVAIDLPGHGGSSLPSGPLLFGELALED